MLGQKVCIRARKGGKFFKKYVYVKKNALVLVSALYCQLGKHVPAMGNTLFSLISIHLCNWRSAINHLKNQCSGNWYSSMLLISNWTVMWEENTFTFVMTLQFYTQTTQKLHKNKNIPPIH
jgi:hypothetical protein